MLKALKKAFEYGKLGLYAPEYALIPFGINRAVHFLDGRQYIGYAYYRVFGFRIAKVQETKPWEKL